MEAVVFQDSPLAEYLEAEGNGTSAWAPVQDVSPSPPSSPSYAPRGSPKVPSKFRNRLPQPLRISIPSDKAVAVIQKTCSKALDSRLGPADNKRFLERFRYLIIASHLLSDHGYHGQPSSLGPVDYGASEHSTPQIGALTLSGAIATAVLSFTLVFMLQWVRASSTTRTAVGRVFTVLTILVVAVTLAYTYLRRQWLHYLRRQNLSEVSIFLAKSQELDASVAATVNLIQEVELVTRGYRVSMPLPPISRLEDRSQTRRCVQLRRILRDSMTELIPHYNRACNTVKPLTEVTDLEKFYDIYDIREMDLQDASLNDMESEFDDTESLRVLKILVARFRTIRKVFLCCLLALEADGGKQEFSRWGTTLDALRALISVTREAGERLYRILGEETSFPVPSTPKVPMTPGHERWRVQLRKIGALSTGIRALQAKMQVLREESDRFLNESEDLPHLAPNLMMQYDSVGFELTNLMQEWEAGRAALASNIDRNEKRMSAMSGMLSPTTSLGGLTSVEESSPSEALRTLVGAGSRSSLELSGSEAEEIFEAVAKPRPLSTLTRDERIMKMKEDRIRRDATREKAEANTHMLRELESVINLRPRGKTMSAARLGENKFTSGLDIRVGEIQK